VTIRSHNVDGVEPLAPVFRALADANRRLLLDRLFERDGQTLGQLAGQLPDMTRFGVMKHLGILEEAGLVTAERVGREKRHYLNPVGIRLIHDRWISKYAAPVVGAMSAMKQHLEGDAMDAPAHVYTAWIRTSPERLWRAITDGEQTQRYYYGTRVVSDWTPGARIEYFYPDGRVAADGEVLEIDEPRRLAMTFHARWDPEVDAAGPIRHVWTIEPDDDGTCKLTVTTLDATGNRAGEFIEGMAYIVSGLKTWLETEEPLAVG
jgi:uncharacterized protein YndB with AHSA1/START domain/DNA-binding transcriptional ArsR family regulator